MEQIQAAPPSSQVLPQIVQVYQPSATTTKLQNPQIIHISHPSLETSAGNVTYQQTITSQSLHIPVTSHIGHDIQGSQIQTTQNQIVMCQETHLQSLQSLQTQMQSQVMQGDMSQPLQITSHVILPQVPVFKQHMLVNGVEQYYGQYEYGKESCIVTKLEPDMQLIEDKRLGCKSGVTRNESEQSSKKRSRSKKPNPSKWACNVRKLKHQRGEAYINRRGKFVPERRVRNTKDCLKSCKYKCNEQINDTDRENIFKAFYSLNANEKKHFLLNTTERNYIRHKSDTNRKRKYSFKYFFVVRAMRHTVCKNFYLGTLAISQKPVYNVHSGKSDMNIPKPDGRGLSESSTHALPSEVKDRVRNHITSFVTIDSKPVRQFSKKKQYLQASLSIKQMYLMYSNDCNKENVVAVKESMYRKIFKQEFNLHFVKIKTEQPLCCKCKEPVKKE